MEMTSWPLTCQTLQESTMLTTCYTSRQLSERQFLVVNNIYCSCLPEPKNTTVPHWTYGCHLQLFQVDVGINKWCLSLIYAVILTEWTKKQKIFFHLDVWWEIDTGEDLCTFLTTQQSMFTWTSKILYEVKQYNENDRKSKSSTKSAT